MGNGDGYVDKRRDFTMFCDRVGKSGAVKNNGGKYDKNAHVHSRNLTRNATGTLDKSTRFIMLC